MFEEFGQRDAFSCWQEMKMPFRSSQTTSVARGQSDNI